MSHQVRVVNKSSDKWRCVACHSKQCTLRRAFGRWPTAGFSNLPKEERLRFWADVRWACGRDMVAKAEELLSTYEDHKEIYYDRKQQIYIRYAVELEPPCEIRGIAANVALE